MCVEALVGWGKRKLKAEGSFRQSFYLFTKALAL